MSAARARPSAARPSVGRPIAVRFRVDLGGQCSVGIGKIELLEGIARAGSLSQAARDMHMSYRRAWLLLADLNSGFDHPVASASTGGRGGGGVVLTEFGARLVAAYRKLESGLQPMADACLKDFAQSVRSSPPPKHVPVASIKRQAPKRAR
jgi:molybdate transport system regulatory protein